jgi:hypothetical protein
MSSIKILFLGSQGTAADALLSPFGQITYSGNETNYAGYQVVALYGSSYQGDLGTLLQSAWKAGAVVGVLDISPAQVQQVVTITGVAPAGTAQGLLAGSSNDGHGNTSYQMRYLLHYDQAVLDVAEKGGISATDLYNNHIKAALSAVLGIQLPVQAPEAPAKAPATQGAPKQVGPPPTNNLIPTFSQNPFSMINVPVKNLSVPVNMYNLSSQSLSVSTTLYIYGENASGNNDFIVIAITQLSNISNGNPVTYTQTEAPSCSSCITNYEWDQFFDYTLTIQAQNGSGQPLSGVTVYTSSPAAAGHGQTTLTDSIGVPNPFSIYMYVLNGGSWQNVNFPASYTNTIDTPTVKWFDITNKDNSASAIGGVDFNIPTDINGWYQGEHTVQQVNFEIISAFRFPASLVQGGKLPVIFAVTVNMGVIQNYSTLISCGSPSFPYVVTSSAAQAQTYKTDAYDLVALTTGQQQKPPQAKE